MKIKVICALVLCGIAVCASAERMVDSQKEIVNLLSTLTDLKSQTILPVYFPNQVPKHPTLKNLYAYVDPELVTKNSYTISIDSTNTCKGAHYCEVGALQVSTSGEPKIYQNMENQNITKSVTLNSDQRASYTPGHALADYWPPMLEWRAGDYFYQLNWQVKNESTLLNTAKSIRTY